METDTYRLLTDLNSEADLLELKKLSTEKLVIWIIGRSTELNILFSAEDIVIESWIINPDKHSMRKYANFPDSHVIMKRIGEMKGKKGLLSGSETIGYKLTPISRIIYANIQQLIKSKSIKPIIGANIADRTISSIDQTPFNRLKRSSAYIKFKEGRLNEIVESDFLYFYGFTWHSKASFIQSRIKNVDETIKCFSKSDSVLDGLNNYFLDHFSSIKEQLLNKL